jgi:putative transposase
MMAKRSVTVSSGSLREWCLTLGRLVGRTRRNKFDPAAGDLVTGGISMKFLRNNGKLQYLWRAVDHDADKKAAKKFFRKLLKGPQYVPRGIVTDKLRSYVVLSPPHGHQRSARVPPFVSQPLRQRGTA